MSGPLLPPRRPLQRADRPTDRAVSATSLPLHDFAVHGENSCQPAEGVFSTRHSDSPECRIERGRRSGALLCCEQPLASVEMITSHTAHPDARPAMTTASSLDRSSPVHLPIACDDYGATPRQHATFRNRGCAKDHRCAPIPDSDLRRHPRRSSTSAQVRASAQRSTAKAIPTADETIAGSSFGRRVL